MNPVTVYLVRHGSVISVNGKRYLGQLEAPLSDRGVEQAWALRKWLEPVEFSAIYCSDLTRSQRTAQIIAGHRKTSVQVRGALREIGLGEWEGYSFREIMRRFPDEFEARGRDLENWRPPGGESFGDCRDRVLPVMNEIVSEAPGNILVVAHAGVNRLLLCNALGIPINNLMSFGQDYGCLNVIEYSEQRCRLQLVNYAPLGTRQSIEVTSINSMRVAGE